MNGIDREQAVSDAFLEMADTLVQDFDVAELMSRLVEHSIQLLDADAAGLLLKDPRGGLQLVASTSESTKLLELFQIQIDEGPCVEAIASARPVVVHDLRDDPSRWPRFGPAAQQAEFLAVHAIPMRLRDRVIGALNLFNHAPTMLSEADVHLAQALADIASVGLIQERVITHAEMVVEQLEGALHSRVVIEQAKGILVGQNGLTMDEAFNVLRAHARSTQTKLTEVANALVEGRIDVPSILPAAKRS